MNNLATQIREAVEGDKHTHYTELLLQAAELLDHKDTQINTRQAAPVEGLETVSWPYQQTFNAIGAAVKIQGDGKAISVKAFIEAFGDELVTRSQAEAFIASERAEKEKWKVRGDQHWDTLRSIREMAREGDCERIILWVNDAGSGYTEPLEATVKSLTDKAFALEADNAALTARVKELEEDVKREAQSSTHNAQDCLDEQLRAEALETRLAAAKLALQPFATDADVYDGQSIDDYNKSFNDNLTVGDLRRARTAWKALP